MHIIKGPTPFVKSLVANLLAAALYGTLEQVPQNHDEG